jgi:hypothetical protein
MQIRMGYSIHSFIHSFVRSFDASVRLHLAKPVGGTTANERVQPFLDRRFSTYEIYRFPCCILPIDEEGKRQSYIVSLRSKKSDGQAVVRSIGLGGV